MKIFSPFISFYQALIQAGVAFSHYFLLALRLACGYGFIQAGLAKFNNIQPTIDFFKKVSIPLAEYQAPLVAAIELGGGVLLIAGLASRLISVPLAVIMIVAYFTAHFPPLTEFVNNPQTILMEKAFLFLMVTLIIFSFGAGKFSFDALFSKAFKKQK